MSGEREAVAIALGQVDELVDAEDEQLGLFGVPATEEGLRRANIKRGPGRPPGARNKRTERTVAFLLARHRDPREVLLELAEANVADLAALLGCSLYQAAQEKRLAAIGVLPYVAQRMPLAVDVTNRQVVYLTINEGQVEQSEATSDSVAVRVLQNVEYQEVSDGQEQQVGQSDVGQSDDDAAPQP